MAIMKLKSSRGAMDSILVSFMLIIIGVGVIGSLASWLTTETNAIKNDANITLEKIIKE